jgi:hypothetical protein
MAKSKSKKTKSQPLTLHTLFGAVSYWGTTVRTLLLAFLAGAIFAARVINMPDSYARELEIFVYIVGSFFLLDTGYVMIARSMPFKKITDATLLLLADLLIGVSYVVSSFAEAPVLAWISTWAIVVVVFFLAIRALAGLLVANPKRA